MYIDTTAALAATVILLLSYVFYNLVFHPLARIPGPFLARISRIWLIYTVRKGIIQHVTLDLHRRYGPVVRISPNEVSIWSAPAVKTVYAAGGDRFPKADWYWITRSDDSPDGLDMLGELNDEKRLSQRRLMGPAYSTTAVQRYEENVDRVLTDFVDALRDGHLQGSDIYVGLHSFMCDALGEVTLSERPGYIQDHHDHGVIRRSDRMWRLLSVVGLSNIGSYAVKKSHYSPLVCLPFLLKPPPASHLNQWLFPQAAKRMAEAESVKAPQDDSRIDMAKDLVILHHKNPSWRLPWTKSMLLTNLGAGHDTATVTLVAFFATVGTHPDVKARLLEELKAANLSDPPKYSEVAALPYLDACLKESMRLYPVTWMSFARKVPSRGANIDGCNLPAGTTIGANPFVAHRNPETFGADAETFRPERWLEGNVESRRAMSRALLIWGGPSRTCPGQHLAHFIVCKLLATLLVKFDVDVEWDKSAFTQAAFLSKLEGVSVKFHPK